LNAQLDRANKLVERKVAENATNVRIRKPQRLLVVLIKLGKHKRLKPRLQATILDRA
jgi:hypothetical protein